MNDNEPENLFELISSQPQPQLVMQTDKDLAWGEELVLSFLLQETMNVVSSDAKFTSISFPTVNLVLVQCSVHPMMCAMR